MRSIEQTGQSPITRADVGFRSARGPLLISLMLSIGLVAIDSTVIATAVPSVVASLGGFHQFPWLFSVYLLAQAVTVPIYGKLADLFGRKPMMLLGIGFFLVGSILCGFAWSMVALIIFRAVQGLGAGAIQPMSMTIVGDVYTTAERGKVQGYLASVWAISSVVGPTLGGVFSQFVDWRWIFFINIPLCLLAGVMLLRHLHEDVVRRKPVLDYRGAVLLTTGVTLLILGLLEGGEAWPWVSPAGIGVPAAGLALLVVFVFVERRAAEPVVPLWVFRRRILLTSSLVSAGVGIVLIGLTSYVPTYVQGVLGTGPLVAGFALATFTLGWPLAASQSGRAYMRFGFRTTAIIGSSVAIAGCLLTTFLGTHTPVWVVGAVCFVVGLGMGWTAAPTLIAAQTTVGWSERGVVTAGNMFSRSVGSAVGVALFGAIANFVLPDLAAASSRVFLSVAVVAILMGAAVVAMPRTPVAAQQ
ncbi:MDR family MFS transporter [Hamadaea sp. NPDC051192]|uniref:MDR family MFS transporter n=1 Tax=Hamadaea sp. NPDC051192 TaxID=3154940 RepID=UPI00342FBD04